MTCRQGAARRLFSKSTPVSDGNEPGSARLKARARWGFARLDSGSGSVF